MAFKNRKNREETDSNKPTHVVKVRNGSGTNVTYDRIGVGWENQEEGSLYVRVHGTQIIEGGFTCYPIEDQS